MSFLNPTWGARLLLGLLLLFLGLGGASGWPAVLAQASGPAVGEDGSRTVFETPFFQLAVDRARPSVELLGYAPAGDGQYGGALGTIVEEAVVGDRRLRSDRDDGDGARLNWFRRGNSTIVQVEGIDLGPAAVSTWLITVPDAEAGMTVELQTTLRDPGAPSALGLSVVGPAVPAGTDPATLVHLLTGIAYRVEVGPAAVERPGGAVGLLAVDNPELSYSATTDRPDRVAARHEDGQVTLGLLQRLPPGRSAGSLGETVSFRFGWDSPFLTTRSDASPQVEARLLAAGYYGNAVLSPILGPVLSASMRDYRGSVWSRDLDYAIQGYSYVLDDMSVFSNTLQQFLERVDRHGIAPEYILLDGEHGNRESWDSMANVIQGTYSLVARTGDLQFYKVHQAALKRALSWIRALDTDDDGLPDRDIFPYGYTDTVENSPLHTYAIAKFYAAHLAMAELEALTGGDPSGLREYAARMKASFERPLDEGGYWDPETDHPIAWMRSSGQIYREFETFGVFEAIRVGLLDQPEQLEAIGRFVDANEAAFLAGNAYPERLIIGGYDPDVRKEEVPLEKLWIMDCNAPWITGLSVPARLRVGRLEAARNMLQVYEQSAHRSTPHAEFGAGPLARYGPGETQDGGRLWDNWSWFSAIYGGHFGLRMTPSALEIQPAPLDPGLARVARNVPYREAHVVLELLDDGYRLQSDREIPVVLYPPFGFDRVEVNGDGRLEPSRQLMTRPGAEYRVRAHQ